MRAQRQGKNLSWVCPGKVQLTGGDHTEKSDKYSAITEKKKKKDLGPELSGHVDPIHQVNL